MVSAYQPNSCQWIIEDKLCLSNARYTEETLFTFRVTHVLNCAWEARGIAQSESRPPSGLVIAHLPMEDTDDYDGVHWMTKGAEFINSALADGGIVMVHCVGGISRSPSVVCAYLVLYQNMSHHAALAHVKACRSFVLVNSGFQQQLASLYDRHRQLKIT